MNNSRGAGHFLQAAVNKTKYWVKREWNYLQVNPVDALFFLTYRCTSRCKTCVMWKRDRNIAEMDLDGWKRAVSMCREMGVRWIELFGGDALLRRDILVPLTEYIKKNDIDCDLTTNCNLMDDETAKGLVGAGIDDIWISLDGVDVTHDEVRGRNGTFERVERGIERLLEARGSSSRPRLRANCTISRHNVHCFENVLAFAERKCMDTVHLEYVGEFWQETLDATDLEGVRPAPYFVRNGHSSLVDREEAFLIKEKVGKLKEQAKNMRVRLYTENIDKLTVDNMVRGRFDNRRCYIIHGKVTVDPGGNILGCPFFDGWKMGNIKDQSLGNIWRNDRHNKIIKAFHHNQLKLCRYCVLGVQRNPTLFQDIRDEFNRFLGRARM